MYKQDIFDTRKNFIRKLIGQDQVLWSSLLFDSQIDARITDDDPLAWLFINGEKFSLLDMSTRSESNLFYIGDDPSHAIMSTKVRLEILASEKSYDFLRDAWFSDSSASFLVKVSYSNLNISWRAYITGLIPNQDDKDKEWLDILTSSTKNVSYELSELLNR